MIHSILHLVSPVSHLFGRKTALFLGLPKIPKIYFSRCSLSVRPRFKGLFPLAFFSRSGAALRAFVGRSEGQADLCSLHGCLLVTHVCRGKHGSGSIGRRKRNGSRLRGRATGNVVFTASDVEQVDGAIFKSQSGQHDTLPFRALYRHTQI